MMGSCGVFAILRSESPYHRLFPDGRLPIYPLELMRVGLLDTDESVNYTIDINRFTDEQLNGLAKEVSESEGGTIAEVLQFLNTERRYPIRADHVERLEGIGKLVKMTSLRAANPS